MENTLLITIEDILHFTSISGSIDEMKINPAILNAMILYLEPVLGSDLFNKIIYLVETNAISGSTNSNYKTLLDEYITPSLVFHTMEFYELHNSFIVAEGGTFQFQPSNANPIDYSNIARLEKSYKATAAKYDEKLSKYLCKNSSLFSEYISNDGLIKKTEVTNQTGWYLGLSNQIDHRRL